MVVHGIVVLVGTVSSDDCSDDHGNDYNDDTAM